jgi:hypothetical protein
VLLEQFKGVTVTIGDAMDESSIQKVRGKVIGSCLQFGLLTILFVLKCMEGCIAAITTLGGKEIEGQQRVDYVGNSNVVEQAGILGVERIILVTRFATMHLCPEYCIHSPEILSIICNF